MKYNKLLFILLIMLFSSELVFLEEFEPDSIYFFYSQSCKYCSQQLPLMHYLDENNSFNINFIDIENDLESYNELIGILDINRGVIPLTYIDGTVFIGYSNYNGPLIDSDTANYYIGFPNQIIKAIEKSRNIQVNTNYKASFMPRIAINISFVFILVIVALLIIFRNKISNFNILALLILAIVVDLFFLSIALPQGFLLEVTDSFPFPVFVTILAVIDGFNPCAFTVLMMFLSVLNYSKDKKRVLLLGITFIITTSFIYFILILAMNFSGFQLIQNYKFIIYLTLGIIILIAGILNIAEFFKLRVGVSLSINKKQKNLIAAKTRKIIKLLKKSKNNKWIFVIALISTIFLAFIVNIIEIGCTAIIPVIFVSSLVDRFGNISIMHYLYSAYYSLLYVLPLVGILISYSILNKSLHLSEKKGRLLKLLSGLVLLFFSFILIFKPELL